MLEIWQLSDGLSVTGQIRVADLAGIAGRGFRTIVNNRPDGEEEGQPLSAELAAEAYRLGLAYRYLPVVPGSISDEQARRQAQTLAAVPGPSLAFCRTGNRSAALWALAAAGRRDPDAILAAARAAGYDLETLRPRLEARARAGTA